MTADAPEPATRPQPATSIPWEVHPHSSPSAIVSAGINVAFMSRTRPQHREADAAYLVYAANELPKREEELRVTQANLDLLTPFVDADGQLDRLQARVARLVKLEVALESMRDAGLRPTVYVCAPGAVKPWACGWSWTDSKGRSQSRHELGDTPVEAVENAYAGAELKEATE